MSIVREMINFYDAPSAASFDMPPERAIAYFRNKGLRITFDWRDMLGNEHAAAFTVAKMADIDMLADVQSSIDEAIAKGVAFRDWSASIIPMLQQRGWWGRRSVIDGNTGNVVVAQLGSPGRLKTIFRTNIQASYAAGHWAQITDQEGDAEYLMYDAVDDHRTRPEHAAWDGVILPVDHPWWKTHYPPNGWNCRCGVVQLSSQDIEDLGLTVSKRAPAGGKIEWTNPRTGRTEKIDKGLDPGWNSNPGDAYLKDLRRVMAEKIKSLPPEMAKAAAQGAHATNDLAERTAERLGIAAAPIVTQTEAQLARGAGKAAERTAAQAIEKALSERGTFLAAAITALQRAPEAVKMSASELYAQAQKNAVTNEIMHAMQIITGETGQTVKMSASGMIVFPDKASMDDAIQRLRDNGYSRWPDGRAFSRVMTYEGAGNATG